MAKGRWYFSNTLPFLRSHLTHENLKNKNSIPSGFSGWHMTEVHYNVQTHQYFQNPDPSKVASSQTTVARKKKQL